MSVIITGSSGYLGSNIVSHLSNDHSLIKPSRQELYDKEYWLSLKVNRPTIIHTAAVTGWKGIEDYECNLKMMNLLIDYCRTSLGSILFFSSVHDTGDSDYAINKRAQMELLTNSGLSYNIIRLSHVLGGNIRERKNYFINHFIECWCNGVIPGEISSDIFSVIKLSDVLLEVDQFISGEKHISERDIPFKQISARLIWEIISTNNSREYNSIYSRLLCEIFSKE